MPPGSGISCRSLLQELRGDTGDDARQLECLGLLAAMLSAFERNMDRPEREETAALLLSSDLLGSLTRMALKRTRQAAAEVFACLNAWRMLAGNHVPAWETADFVEAIVQAFNLLIGDDVSGTDWEARSLAAGSQRCRAARLLALTEGACSGQAFGIGVTFFEALLDSESHPCYGAGRAVCREGLGGSIARALLLKPELVRMPRYHMHGLQNWSAVIIYLGRARPD